MVCRWGYGRPQGSRCSNGQKRMSITLLRSGCEGVREGEDECEGKCKCKDEVWVRVRVRVSERVRVSVRVAFVRG